MGEEFYLLGLLGLRSLILLDIELLCPLWIGRKKRIQVYILDMLPVVTVMQGRELVY